MSAENKTLKLTLEVEYDIQDADERELRHNLEQIVMRAMGDGSVTSDTSAEVDGYRFEVRDASEAKANDIESRIEDYLLDQIESGGIDLGDITKEMVKFGMMDPVEFVNKMTERMRIEEEGVRRPSPKG